MAKKKPTPDNLAKPNTSPFDLRIERWIPVVRQDGSRDELSIVEVLLTAHQLSEICDPMPTVEFGLYRLLTAVVLDIFQPDGLVALKELIDAGSFDAARIDNYFKTYSDRFDLFHPTYPFLQTAGMDVESPKPIAGLLHPIPSGTNASHFHHGQESDFAVSPAVAVRLLTTLAPFMTAGGAGLSPSINGAPPWYVLPRGSTLFDTICLNLPVDRGQFPLAVDDEPPAWRSPRKLTSERRTEASLVESLTWRPRRIQLIADGPGICAMTKSASTTVVSKMFFAAGFGAGFDWNDPNASYVIKADGVSIVRPKEGRAIWRDSGPLLFLRRGEYVSADGKSRFERPGVISQFATMVSNRWVNRESVRDFVVYGMRTDMKMKVFEWQREILCLPGTFVWTSLFHNISQEEMERADGVAFAIRQAIRRAYPRDGAGNSKAYASMIDRAQNSFWDSLRLRFDELLKELSSANGPPELLAATAKWRECVKSAAWGALDDVIGDLDGDGDSLERLVVTRRVFHGKLSQLLSPEDTKSKKTKGRLK